MTLRRDGTGVVVNDTANGVEIRFPGVPEVTTDTAPISGGRPVVNVALRLEEGSLLFEAFRLNAGEVPPEALDNFYKGTGLGLAKSTGANVERADVTLLDHPAVRFTVTRPDQGTMRTWVVKPPGRNVFYQIIAKERTGSPTGPGDAFIASLKATAPAR